MARYVPLLIEGDLDGLLELFGNVPRVNDPRLGWVEGPRFELFVAASCAGLSLRQAHVEHLTTTRTALGAVEECVLSLVRAGRTVRLPVAIAAVVTSDILTSLRIYHSMLPLMGAHAIRGPILPALPDIHLPGAVERYHERLAAGDLAGTLEQFDVASVVREPAGEVFEHRGRAEVRRFYTALLARGGISVERCALTDDGTSCAFEYNLAAWGRVVVPRQAGIAVYERAPTGLLAAVRLYDDFERPTDAA